jgi:formylglycine-generating enzyme required for sulfatase activity
MIGMPIKIGNIEVAQYDFPNQMNWVDAKKACESLGDGWRLPTKEELDKLYQYKNRIESFNTGNYWSSTESDFNNAYYLGFDNGGLDQVYKKYTGYVRAVRTF